MPRRSLTVPFLGHGVPGGLGGNNTTSKHAEYLTRPWADGPANFFLCRLLLCLSHTSYWSRVTSSASSVLRHRASSLQPHAAGSAAASTPFRGGAGRSWAHQCGLLVACLYSALKGTYKIRRPRAVGVINQVKCYPHPSLPTEPNFEEVTPPSTARSRLVHGSCGLSHDSRGCASVPSPPPAEPNFEEVTPPLHSPCTARARLVRT